MENMDRFLSKAKRVDNGEWAYGYIIQNINHRFIIVLNDSFYMINGNADIINSKACEVDPSTLCQCTGLKDDKDNLIFEGDLLMVTHIDWDCADVFTVENGLYNQYAAFELKEASEISCDCNALQLITIESDYYVEVTENIHDKEVK